MIQILVTAVCIDTAVQGDKTTMRFEHRLSGRRMRNGDRCDRITLPRSFAVRARDFRPLWLLLGAFCVFQLAAAASAQQTPTPGVDGPPAMPGGPPVNPRPDELPATSKAVSYSVVPAGPGGLYAYVPGQWAMVNINLANPTDTAAQIRCATYFDSESSLQFGRTVWLPAHSRMRVSHPILVPRIDESKGRVTSLGYHSLVENAGSVIREDTAQVLHQGSFLPTLNRPVTGLIQDLEGDEEDPRNPPYDLVVASRVRMGYGRQIADLKDDFLPPDEESLQALDQLVISSSRILNDQAGLSAIRQWVGGGGKLWIMLDSLDPEVLPAFFGDDWRGEYVDRTFLAQVKIDAAKPSLGGGTELVEYEKPVPFARIITQTDDDVWYTVNGWPAAFWRTFGSGRVLITTLGPDAWMALNETSAAAAEQERRRSARAARLGQPGAVEEPGPEPALPAPRPNAPPGAPQPGAQNPSAPASAAMFSLFVVNEPMSRLAGDLLVNRMTEATPAQLLTEQVGEYVGYEIPSRGKVLGTQAAFVLVLGALALVFWKWRRLELLSWCIPVAALAAGGWLILLGRASRHASPSSMAVVQLVKGVPGTHEYQSSGVGAVFSPEGTERTLGMKSGGRVVPDMEGLTGMNRRMEWSDLGNWSWQNLALPPGMRTASVTRSGTTVAPFIAEATFGPEGLTGRLQLGDAKAVSDAIISTPEGRLGVTLAADGTFTASSSQVLAKNAYLSATLLTDEQNRRQRTVRRLLESVDPIANRTPIQVFAWTEPWVDGLQLDTGRQLNGSALVQVPLSIRRPLPGTEFTIPSPLLPFRNLRGTGPDGVVSSALWNFTKNEGAERDQPGTAWLQFQTPTGLSPLEGVAAQLRIEVSGPMGLLELAGWKQGKLEILKSWRDPAGALLFEISDPEVLSINSDGTFILRLSAGDPSRPQLTSRKENGQELKSTWKIESLSVDLRARALDADAP